MQPIKMNKAKLLEVVRENRDKHRAVFEAAMEGWYKEAVRQVDEVRDTLLAKKMPRTQWGDGLHLELSCPQDHTADYDRVIRMVEMEVREKFTLSENDFAAYVQDDWAWKRQWAKVSSSLAPQEYTSNYGVIAEED